MLLRRGRIKRNVLFSEPSARDTVQTKTRSNKRYRSSPKSVVSSATERRGTGTNAYLYSPNPNSPRDGRGGRLDELKSH